MGVLEKRLVPTVSCVRVCAPGRAASGPNLADEDDNDRNRPILSGWTLERRPQDPRGGPSNQPIQPSPTKLVNETHRN